MKNTLSTILCVLLTIALVAGAVCIGAVRGWHGEMMTTLQSLSAASELSEPLRNRAMDAANLAVVARRHLGEDPDVVSLSQAYFTVCRTNASAAELALADTAISVAAASLADKLQGLDSVAASQRDQVYISTLTRNLSQDLGSAETYTQAIEDYNRRLTTSLTGKLAMLLGAEPIPAIAGGN